MACRCEGDADPGPTPEERTAIDRRVHELITLACTRRGQPPPPRWRPGVDPPPRPPDNTHLPVTTGARTDDDTADSAGGPIDDHQRPVNPGARADDDIDRAGRIEHDPANPAPQAGTRSPVHEDEPTDLIATEPGLVTPGIDTANTTRSNRGRCLALPVTDPFDLAGLDLVPAPDPTDPFDQGRCEIPGAGPIPVARAQRLACNGRIARLVLGAASVPLDYGRAQRTATPEQRHALIARDHGCAFPGCDRPPAWCEAHHLDFWDQHHGPTDIDNLALLCSHHHHCVHDWHWTFTRTPTGWLAQSPTGTRLHRAIPS